MSLKEPIVEGAYYEQDGTKRILGPAVAAYNALTPHFILNGKGFRPNGEPLTWEGLGHLTRQVHIVPTDPAEVVAELRRRSAECEPPGEEVYGEEDNFQSGRSIGCDDSADLVESMLGLARCGEGCDGNCELTAPGPTKAEVELAELRSAAAKIVAELRERARVNLGTCSEESDLDYAADLVAEKLGVK